MSPRLIAAVGVTAALLAATWASAPLAARWEPLDDRLTELRHAVIAASSALGAPQIEAGPVPAAHLPESPIGVNAFLDIEPDPDKRRRSLQLAHAAGARWIRQQFRWDEIEHAQKGSYVDREHGGSSWAKYDEIVDTAGELGLQLIARLDTSPTWARAESAPDSRAPPLNYSDYADFAEAVARRYRGGVRHYQLWNEPNLASEWGGGPVDPVAYTRLLTLAAERIRQVDSEAVILAATLSPTLEQSPRALNELMYLHRMYEAGAARLFDIVSVNAYGLRGGPYDRRVDDKDVTFSRPMLVREVMVWNGDGHKPIWASEMGWNAAPSDLPLANEYGRVSARLQAKYTVEAYERARQEWPWMGVMALWFLRRPDDREKDQPWSYYRMLEPDFSPLPVYQAVRAYSLRMGYATAN